MTVEQFQIEMNRTGCSIMPHPDEYGMLQLVRMHRQDGEKAPMYEVIAESYTILSLASAFKHHVLGDTTA